MRFPGNKAVLKVGLSHHAGTPEYERYAAALLDAGVRFGFMVEPVWLSRAGDSFEAGSFDGLAGIVFTGGADVAPDQYGFSDPHALCRFSLERDAAEFPMAEQALERGLPVLAICRGMQLINVVCGGTLIPDLPDHDPQDESSRHAVTLDPRSFLANRVAGLVAGDVNSSHHQAVDRPGAGLRVVGASTDGIAEAIEWEESEKKPWLAAVQWHPERMSLDEPLSGALYAAFLRNMI